MTNSQSQKGGEGSTNIQTQQMVVHVGIDEKRAREIYQEMNLQLRNDYSKEALNVANARVSEFENRLLPKMEQVEGSLEAFADPSFQLLLVEAQKAAASTERPADYDLLSELLIHRFERGENRVIRAGISLAIEIVDKVSDEALLGLTLAHALSYFGPVSANIHEGLDALNSFFGKIIYSELPKGQDWIDHLDILNAVRLNPLLPSYKVNELYPRKLPGYVDIGIKKKSRNYKKALEILKNNNLPANVLVDHSFNSDYVRVLTLAKESISDMCLHKKINNNGNSNTFLIKLTEAQIKAIESIYDLYSDNARIKQDNINQLMVEWDKRQNLKAVREWWDNITTYFNITSVGRVLAHSNAQRCDKNLEPLEWENIN